jgi:general secretion pathway protein F
MRRRSFLLCLLTGIAVGFFVWLWRFQNRGPLPSPKEVNDTLNELAIAIQQGMPLTYAIEQAVNRATHPRLKRAWEDVLKTVSQGSSLSRAMSAHRDIFPNELIITVQKGEIQGKVNIVLLNYTARQ